MKDYIYIIGNDQGYIKIGVSNNVKRRLRQIQTGNEHKLTLLFTEEFECTRKHLLHIEREIHRNLHKLATKCIGEWFCVEEDNIDAVKRLITYYRIRYEDNLFAFEKPFT